MRQPEREMIHRLVFVIHQINRSDAQDPSRESLSIGVVTDGQINGTLGTSPTGEMRSPAEAGNRLSPDAVTPVAANPRSRKVIAFHQRNCLGIILCSNQKLVAFLGKAV